MSHPEQTGTRRNPPAGASVDVTVIIPTLNGERYLGRLLDMLEAQEFGGILEVLVIDSGSTDSTLEIVRSRPWVRLHEIPNSEFGHGTTRNLGARLARGRNLAYLTQDAIPATTLWLGAMTAPLDPAGLDAVAVMGKQEPRPGCFPLLKYEIQTVFARFGPDLTTTIYQRGESEPSATELEMLAFFSDVNSATRRDFLLNTIPFRDLAYSEDTAFGRDVIEAGYRKAYAPEGCVEHSNDLTLREYGQRIFDETISLRRLGSTTPSFNWLQQVLRAGYGILRDSVRIVRDPDYGFARSLFWLVVNPAFHVVKWLNYHRANRTGLDDQRTIDAHSLEYQRLLVARRDAKNPRSD